MKKNFLLILMSCLYSVAVNSQTLNAFEANGKYGYKDATGKIVIAAKYDATSNFIDNIAAVTINKKSGIIDKNGNQLTKLIYDSFMPEPNHSIIWVTIGKKIGLINFQGKELTAVQFDETKYFYEQKLAPVKKGELWGFIDTNGKEIVPFKYKSANYFTNERARVSNDTGIGFIDEKGKEIIPSKFEEADFFDDFGICIVKHKGSYEMIDKNGEFVTPPYKTMKRFKSNVYAAIPYGNKDCYNFVDSKNQIIKTTAFTQLFYPFENEKVVLWRVANKDGKYGFINTDLNLVINTIYDDAAFYFMNGLCPVKLNNKWGVIDVTGKTIIPFQYDSIKIKLDLTTSTYKNYKVSKDNKEFIIDPKGTIVKE